MFKRGCQFLGFFIFAFFMPAYANRAHVINVGGAITPVTAKFITDHVELAEEENAVCLIIQLDTPGGLLDATLAIDKKILSADVPVIVYISPRGGRAASAGVFISYAAHIVVMAPSTNIGSAHPVSLVGKDSSKVMMDKIVNDAVAHIKGLAEERGRNGTWAEAAIRESANITEKQALQENVINFIAEDMDDLLHQIDGQTVHLADREVTLNTKNILVEDRQMNWRYKILDKISNPNIAYILMLLGGLGLFFELQNPGTILPGIVGAVCIVLFLFSTQVLSINLAGFLLILLAVVFFILELNVPSFGLLTIGGIVSMILGSIMLFKAPSVSVSLGIILPAAIATAAFFLFALGLGLKAQHRKPASGQKGMIGEKGVVIKALNPEGQISIHGEIWKAVSSETVRKGEKVEVADIEGLTLRVKKINRDSVKP